MKEKGKPQPQKPQPQKPAGKPATGQPGPQKVGMGGGKPETPKR